MRKVSAKLKKSNMPANLQRKQTTAPEEEEMAGPGGDQPADQGDTASTPRQDVLMVDGNPTTSSKTPPADGEDDTDPIENSIHEEDDNEEVFQLVSDRKDKGIKGKLIPDFEPLQKLGDRELSFFNHLAPFATSNNGNVLNDPDDITLEILKNPKTYVLATIVGVFTGGDPYGTLPYPYKKVPRIITKAAKFILGQDVKVKLTLMPYCQFLIVDARSPENVAKLLEKPVLKSNTKVVVVFKKLLLKYQKYRAISITGLRTPSIYTAFEKMLKTDFQIEVSQ
jgi:hypothetical protein